MEYGECLKMFVLKHNFNTNVTVQLYKGNTWYDVVSVIFNENDIPQKVSIPIEDIEFDILSDLPKDIFIKWVNHITENEYISYKDWFYNNCIYHADIENKEIDLCEQKIENVIDKLFSDFASKYSDITEYEDSDFDDIDEEDDFDDIDE